MSKSDFINVIQETRLLLNDNSEWRERYSDYAKIIRSNITFIKSVITELRRILEASKRKIIRTDFSWRERA